jgi:hypothetical protein
MTSQSLSRTWHRAYGDFFKLDRMPAFATLIRNLLDHGYVVCSVLGFWQILQQEAVLSGTKYAVLRHDVDTDPGTARRMWEVERRLAVQSSYYFRRSTIDIPLMQEIHRGGSEASYHYEELAAFAKKRGLTRREELQAAMPHLRDLFRQNLKHLREVSGLPMLTVASHGDFVNRKLGVANHVILQDRELRSELNIVLEGYDDALMKQMTSRCSDSAYPGPWDHSDPEDSIRHGEPRIHILIHPRQWHASPWINLADDIRRCWEGFSYLRAARSHSLHPTASLES